MLVRSNALLIQDGRLEDLMRAVGDEEFRWQLMADYGINRETDGCQEEKRGASE